MAEQPVLQDVLGYPRAGDTLVVRRWDRLGRSLQHPIETVTLLAARGIGFKSLIGPIDTTTSGGKLVFHVFGALAEFERDLVRERTHARLAAASARGGTGGRPKAHSNAKKLVLAHALYDGGQIVATSICRTLGMSRATLDRYIRPPSREQPADSYDRHRSPK